MLSLLLEHTPPEASPAASETKPAPSGAADPSGPKGGGGGGAEMAPKAGDAQDKAKKGLMTKEKAEIGTVCPGSPRALIMHTGP